MNSNKPLLNKNSSPQILPSEGSHARGHLRQFFIKLRDAIGCRVPLGYEDESGFHFGVHPGYVVQEALTETGTETAGGCQQGESASAPGVDSSRPPSRMFVS